MTNERIDHAAEARELMGKLPASFHTDELLALSQVHATLALVEQQHIANRIAIGVALRDEARLQDKTAPSSDLGTWLYSGGGILGYFLKDEKEAMGL